MTQYYTVFGQKVASQYLAMATLTTLFAGSYLAVSGPSKPVAASPPINASSSDEADFIKKFMESIEGDDKKAPAAAKH
ncbi:hypothetical protein B0T19DRAFT_427634 [Cercophora scortea]|uniref:ATP synthase subunit K, mitochondrial n=1 Tax=Cercophora scortea TaxID=314031 RepID=A0AAE0IFE8_9PEZI|nr:hypothetical protein B0T19DRAFT_427634 [Cercophora scortea]